MTKALDRRYEVRGTSAIDVKALETFPFEFPGNETIVTISTDEFTTLCPWSGLPDFAAIRIEYIPSRAVLELRSLKYYLLSYRNVGIYQEHLVNRVLEDLVRVVKPSWMKITADYRVRGGIHTVASREYRKGRK